MRPLVPIAALAGAWLASGFALGLAGSARAGGSTCSTCAPPPACCNIPSTHTITVPGVTITPLTIVIAPPRITGGVEGGFSGSVDVSVSTSAQAGASTSAFAQTSALAVANSQAANLLAASGGGTSVFSEGGTSGNIPNLIVAAPQETSERVCVRHAAVEKTVAVQAVCLDDKLVPHPASQVAPGRDVAPGYAGELFRCVAGAHMQYILADFAGEARFDHGQTVVCQKGDALWRDVTGRLQCRPQTPARDCNERSLLRRYGAGIKVLRSAAEQCVEWSTRSVQAEATSAGALALDGGVGG